MGHVPLEFTWNELSANLGPLLIVQATEVELKGALIGAALHRIKVGGALPYPSIADSDFQKVKLQLRALGLIRELKDGSAGGDDTIWT